MRKGLGTVPSCLVGVNVIWLSFADGDADVGGGGDRCYCLRACQTRGALYLVCSDLMLRDWCSSVLSFLFF